MDGLVFARRAARITRLIRSKHREKKVKNAQPHWQPDGLLNIASAAYARRKERLSDVLLLAERLSADNPADPAAV